MKEWNIVWHYRDLRIQDNPALAAAARGNTLPLFIYSPEEEGAWAHRGASLWWLHHSLEALKKEYQKLGTHLLIRSGTAQEVFNQLFKEISISGVFWNERYEPALRTRDETIETKLKKEHISVHRFEGNYLITPAELLNKTGSPYSVFTPFSKTFLQEYSWRKTLSQPKKISPHSLGSETLADLDLLPKPNWAEEFPKEWSPGRSGAIALLKTFTKKSADYEETRNLPATQGTSKLSPHLHFGEISPHEVWETIEKSENSEPFLRQLIWREFANYFLFHSPQTPDHSWREKFNHFPWEKNAHALKAWQQGMTGYPIVDAGMRELWHTGWMHNRVRMITASFLVKDLHIHWLEGARWFWDTLVDADLANNTMGWQWVAGCGPDAAPYFRIFNPISQGKKFDPEGEYIRHWVPELANVPTKWIHCPWEAPEEPRNYPPPIVDHAEARRYALEAYKNL